MTKLKPFYRDGTRRTRNYRAAAAAVFVIALAATVVFHAGPPTGGKGLVPGLASMPAAAANDDYLRTPARDPSVPRAQDVFAAPVAAQDEPQPLTF